MTSEQIKQLPILGIDTKLDGFIIEDAQAALMVQQNLLIREIAYQLAVMNEHCGDHVPVLNLNAYGE